MGATQYDVFLSHAGQQKKGFVDGLNCVLSFIRPQLKVFMDEHSLNPNDDGWAEITAAAETASIGVVVLSKEFLCKECPMAELEIFMKRWQQSKSQDNKQKDQDNKKKFFLVPVVYGVTWQELEAVSELYASEDWPAGVARVTDQATLEHWAKLVAELCRVTAVRLDQTNGYEGELMIKVVDVIIAQLKELGHQSGGWQQAVHLDRMQLPKPNVAMVGRDELVEELQATLFQHGVAVLVAGPGEGKSTVANQVANNMCDSGACPRGAFSIDFAGFGESDRVQDKLVGAVVEQCQRWEVAIPKEAKEWGDGFLSWLQRGEKERPGALLLVLENTEDVLRHEDAAHEFQDCVNSLQKLQDCDHCSSVMIIINSRSSPDLDLKWTIQLPPLAPEVAEKLLLDISSRSLKPPVWEQGQAAHLASICGCNALIVTMIAKFIANGRCTPQGAIDTYEKHGQVTKVPSKRRSSEKPEYRLKQQRVTLLWLESYLQPEEQWAVAVLSAFRASFSEAGAAALGADAGLDMEYGTLGVLLTNLEVLSVLRATDKAGRYNMHPLIRELGDGLRGQPDSLLEQLQSRLPGARAEELSGVKDRLVRWMVLDAAGPGEQLRQCNPNREWGNVAGCLEVLKDEEGNFREAGRLLLSYSVEGLDDTQKEELVEVAGEVGLVMMAAGRYQAALVWLKQVVDSGILWEEHVLRLQLTTSIISARKFLGDLEGALQLAKDHAERCRRVGLEKGLRGVNPTQELIAWLQVLNEQSAIYSIQGDYQRARAVIEGHLSDMQTKLPAGEPILVMLRLNLARALMGLGDVEGARRLDAQQQASHLQGANALILEMNTVARVMAAGNLAEARARLENVLASMETWDSSHMAKLTAQANYAKILNRQMLLDEAAARLIDVIGAMHDNKTDAATQQAASVQGDLSIWQEKMEQYDRVVALLDDVHGTLQLELRQDQLEAALFAVERIREKCQPMFQDQIYNPTIFRARGLEALVAARLGRLEDAKQKQEALLEVLAKVREDNKAFSDVLENILKGVLRALEELADHWSAHQEYEAAAWVQVELANWCSLAVGDQHPATVMAQQRLEAASTNQPMPPGPRGYNLLG